MDLLASLTQLGLSGNQAKVYLACLQLGNDTVMNIAKYAGLKRPTVYLLLDDLAGMGLITRAQTAGKTTYTAHEPERILNTLQKKEELAQNILPTLKAIYNIDPEKPNIKIADNVESVRNIYNNIFSYLSHHPTEELIIYGSLKDAMEHFEIEVVDYFQNIMKHSQNNIREIGNNDVETRRYYRRSVRLNPHHEIRLMRDDNLLQSTDNMLYGNTLVIFSVRQQIFAITIESATIAATYRSMFNMAWRAGKKI